MKSFLRLSLLMAAGASLNVHAVQIDMKPGLWEHQFKMDAGAPGSPQNTQAQQMSKAMEEMQKQMQNLPPEQRKMMEDMMAQQGIKVSDKGIEMASQGAKISKDGATVKACITQEQIDRGELPKTDDNCEEKITQSSARSYKVSYVCKGENPTRGEGDIVFQSDKAYTGNVSYTTTIDNKPETFHATQAGKWLSTDCGAIKPVDMQQKK